MQPVARATLRRTERKKIKTIILKQYVKIRRYNNIHTGKQEDFIKGHKK
jgi:hypothetical protein